MEQVSDEWLLDAVALVVAAHFVAGLAADVGR